MNRLYIKQRTMDMSNSRIILIVNFVHFIFQICLLICQFNHVVHVKIEYVGTRNMQTMTLPVLLNHSAIAECLNISST